MEYDTNIQQPVNIIVYINIHNIGKIAIEVHLSSVRCNNNYCIKLELIYNSDYHN